MRVCNACGICRRSTLEKRYQMTRLLDPWNDAALIAKRLSLPGSRLIVIIGAEQWCDKCRQLKPAFEALASQLNDNNVLLWLDIEDHQEFMGSYMPEDLPELHIYDQGKLVHCQVIQALGLHEVQALLKIPVSKLRPLSTGPGITQRLMQADWANPADSL